MPIQATPTCAFPLVLQDRQAGEALQLEACLLRVPDDSQVLDIMPLVTIQPCTSVLPLELHL